ncbi:MAG TPA: chloride channel protein [Gaiellaceae bacterium]|nr:chloride channel protein [Gaiellaceae bacterium]
MSVSRAPPVDPGALIRSRSYRALLAFAAVVGVLVSLASWGFLELVHAVQVGVYTDLPGDLGYDTAPWWWPLPWLALAGALTAFAIERLPGRGGHVPAEGLKTGGGQTQPIELPGVLLAATATLGLGLVLGPEGPLIALGMGLAILAVRLAKKDAPERLLTVMAAAGSFAAISTIFGSPVIGAVILIEAAGLAGPTLPVVLLPGLIAAGIGSLVFIGMGGWTGLSTSAWALTPFALAPFDRPGWGDFGWTIALGFAAAVVVFVTVEVARLTTRLVARRPFLLTTAAALVVGGLAIAFNQATDQPVDAVLFSGQDAIAPVIKDAPALSLWTFALLLVFKGLAWSISLGNFRGGPTFPALFLGVVGGLLAGHLPGFSQTPAVAALMGAACVSILRLPLSSIVIALLLTSKAGLGVAPLIIVAVTVAYITTEVLAERRVSVARTPEARSTPLDDSGRGARPYVGSREPTS